MVNPLELRSIILPEVENSFRTLSATLLQRGVDGDAPIELLDLFDRYPVIEVIRDNVEVRGREDGMSQAVANMMANGGIMPVGALARYDETHKLGVMTDLEEADIAQLLASFLNKGPQEVPRIARAYPVIEHLIDLTLEDALNLGASGPLAHVMAQGTAYSLGIVVELAEKDQAGLEPK